VLLRAGADQPDIWKDQLSDSFRTGNDKGFVNLNEVGDQIIACRKMKNLAARRQTSIAFKMPIPKFSPIGQIIC